MNLKNLFWSILLLSLCIIGCRHVKPTTSTTTPPPSSKCAENVAASTTPERLKAIPELTSFRTFADPAGDFLRDQPFYEENFRVPGVFERASIPSTLDLREIRVGPEGANVMFQIRVEPNKESSPTLEELLGNGRRTAQIGVYIDTDRNGVSDFVAVTTAKQGGGGLIVGRNVNERVARVETRISGSDLTMFIPKTIIGTRFAWAAFSGFTPVEGNYYHTQLPELFFLPIVDVYYPQFIPSNVGFSTAFTGTSTQCSVTETNFHYCPAEGNPTLVTVPNTSYQGVLLYDVHCDGRGYSFWCLSQSFFGKHVYDTGQEGWIAKCPYTYGCNSEQRWDQNGDGLVDEIIHTVFDSDGNCNVTLGGPHHDQDADGLLDSMVHTYLYAPNTLTSCNVNRNYDTNLVVNKTCKPAQPPYSNPAMVPGSLP